MKFTTLVVIAALVAGCGGGSNEAPTLPVAPQPLTALDIVRPLAVAVRAMADDNENAAPGTLLEQTAQSYSRGVPGLPANCVDFALTLLALIAQQAPTVQAREFAACLVTNSYDCHSLIEVNESGRWVLVDPYFAIIPHNADGSGATAADMQSAVRSMNWRAISYEYLTEKGASFAHRNYLDWPTYFVNSYEIDNRDTLMLTEAPYSDVQRFYQPAGTGYGIYAVQCNPGADSAVATIDDKTITFPCDKATGMTRNVGVNTTVNTVDGVLVQPRRFVFTWDGTCNVMSVCTAP